MQPPCAFVVIQQKCCLPTVSFQSHANLFGRVVGPLFKQSIGMLVAGIVNFWRLEVDVVNLSADRTTTAARRPLFQKFARYVDEDCADVIALFRRKSLEHFSLCGGARKTVEDVALPTVFLAGSLLD